MATAPTSIRRPLMRWYRAHGRHALPWRQSRDPYAVLVSEVMLQQTQVSRVLPYFERWMSRWPTPAGLAAASPADAIREWAGLGYNRRALNLHRAAAAAVARFGGQVPAEVAALESLPGVGPYTAGTVACFAAGARVPFADTNISRVLARAVLGAESAKAVPPSVIRDAAAALLPARGARDHNLALMDLGALLCTSRSPTCGVCPLSRTCAWRAAGNPEGPPRGSRPAPPFAQTARFARGRIIAALRHSGMTEHNLRAVLPERHQGHLAAYLHALERDGLITFHHGLWQLPTGSPLADDR